MSSEDNDPAHRPEWYAVNWCFCISLKTGCFLIAYMGLVEFTLMIVLNGYILGLYFTRDIPKPIRMVAAPLIFEGLLILSLIFYLVLIVGIHKNKPGNIKAFFYYKLIYVMLYMIDMVADLVRGCKDTDTLCETSTFIHFMRYIYYLLVIRSFYYEMKRRTEQSV